MEHLIEAIERTRQWGLMDPATNFLVGVLPTPEFPAVVEAVQDALCAMYEHTGWGPEALATRCLDPHTGILPMLLAWGIPAVLTLGKMIVDGEVVSGSTR